MSLAADMAFDKGMIVVVSAGNEGNKPWQNVTPPSDARNVLAIGAVGTDSLIASFSSRGHMEDGRIKPDLVSVGKEPSPSVRRDRSASPTAHHSHLHFWQD